MSMNLNQLRVFHAVAKGGSFTQAAQALSITQPAVTVHIRELERYYGVRLFDRGGRRVKLTDAGQTLFEYAQRIFTLAEEAEHALENVRSLRAGRLQILGSLTVGAYYLPPVINLFKAKFPEIQSSLSVDNSQHVVERSRASGRMWAFSRGPSGTSGWWCGRSWRTSWSSWSRPATPGRRGAPCRCTSWASNP